MMKCKGILIFKRNVQECQVKTNFSIRNMKKVKDTDSGR